jgi:hypothetical protein
MSNVVNMADYIDPDEAERELRLRMIRDAGLAWKTLMALAQYGMSDEIKLDAAKVALAYSVGLPIQRVETKSTVSASGRTPALQELSDDELRALRTLRDAQKRRALESGE